MKARLYVCDTCCHQQVSGGEGLREYLHEAAAQNPRAGEFEICTITCFMACEQGCNVSLQAPGKISYLAGKFAPTPQSAAAILQYVGKYLDSADGDVSYMDTPRSMMGHILARLPARED